METIQVYLDNMFLNIPDSEQVRRIKTELYDMMEDKYHELIVEGKPENEAVGIVISEFGNLEELKEELGLDSLEEQTFSDSRAEQEEKGKEQNESSGKKNKKNKKNKKKFGYQEDAEKRQVSFDEVEDYLQTTAAASNCISVGAMLCVWAPAALVALSEYENWGIALGLALLFILVAAGVALFILSGTRLEQYKYLKEVPFGLDPGVEQFVREEQEAFHQPFVLQNAIGVILCIISPVQLLVCSILELSDSLILFGVGVLLLLVGIGTFFLVRAGMRKDAYRVLLQEECYRKEKKNGFTKTFESVYWLAVSIIYLKWSFSTGFWGFSWVIWVIAGVAYDPVEKMLRKL